MRSKLLFKLGLSYMFISIYIIFMFILMQAPAIVICMPLIMTIPGIFIALMGGKKVIINEKFLKVFERKVHINEICNVVIVFPLIKINYIKNGKKNKFVIDYVVETITKIEKYINANKIKYENKMDIEELPASIFEEKKIKKDEIHSLFKPVNDKDIALYNIFQKQNKINIVLHNNKVISLKKQK